MSLFLLTINHDTSDHAHLGRHGCLAFDEDFDNLVPPQDFSAVPAATPDAECATSSAAKIL